METPAAPERLAFVDGLRGLAALSVALFHFYAASSLHEPLGALCPRPLAFLLEHGYLGVQIFFVISGFVIAYSLRRTRVTLASAANFGLRRQIRLDPPYWATIALLLAVHQVVAARGHDASEWPWPPVPGVLAHFVYLQGILGYPQISVVFWTLCIEVQFYVVYIALLAVAERLESAGLGRGAARLVVFAPLGVASLAAHVTGGHEAWFLPWWAFFGLGVLACWTFEGALRPAFLLAFAALVLSSLIGRLEGGPIVAVATALAIHAAGATGRMNRWLRGSAVQLLGRLSYCLYLLHVVVGNAALGVVHRALGDSPASALAAFVAAVAGSLGAAYLLHRAVERPAVRFARRFKPGDEVRS